jgi:hypothetical protein
MRCDERRIGSAAMDYKLDSYCKTRMSEATCGEAQEG